MSEETSSSRIEKVKKPRPAMTEAQRAGLAKGRARLAASRQAVKDRIMVIEEDPINAVARKPLKKPQRVIVEDESESESEPEEIHVVRRRTKKPASKVVYHSEDEEESEEEAPVSKRTPARAPAPVRRATARPSRARAVTPPPEEEPFTVHFF